MYLQKKLLGQESSSHSFIAGTVGGYIVFGENNNINQQVSRGNGYLNNIDILSEIRLFTFSRTDSLVRFRAYYDWLGQTAGPT